MKKVTNFLKRNKVRLPVLALFVAIGVTLTHFAYGAGNATLTLTPASGSYQNGAEFTVTIKENSGSETVNAVQADLSYDASKLQFVSLSTAGSPFTSCVQTTGGGGNVTIACAILSGPVTGNQTVGSVTFKALVGSGSSNVTFKSSSAVAASTDNSNLWNGSTTGGTYSFTTPATPTCPAGQTGTYPNCTTPPSGGGGGNTSSGGGGSSSSSSSSSGGSSSSTSGGTSSTPSTTTPTTGTDTTVPTTVNENGSVQGGTLVAVRVLDEDGKPIADATVTIGSETAKTDKTGVASFTSIKPGKYTVTAKTAKGGQVKAAVTVKSSSGVGQVQSFDLKLKSPNYTLIYVGLGVLVLAGVGAIGYIILRNFKGPGSPWSGGKKSKMVSGDSLTGDSPKTDESIDEKIEKVKAETPSPSAVITPKSS